MSYKDYKEKKLDNAHQIEKNYNKSDIKSIFDAYQNGQLEAQIKVGSNEIKIDFKLTFDYFSTIALFFRHPMHQNKNARKSKLDSNKTSLSTIKPKVL